MSKLNQQLHPQNNMEENIWEDFKNGKTLQAPRHRLDSVLNSFSLRQI